MERKGVFFMICPYCDKEMQKGCISCDGRCGIHWTPEEKQSDIWSKMDRALGVTGQIQAAKKKFTMLQIEAYYCEDCQKMIFDTTVSK